MRARLASPAPAACVERTLLAQEIVDTTTRVIDRLGTSAVAARPPYDSTAGLYVEVAYAGAGGGGQVVQQMDVEGSPMVTISWTWAGTRPSDDSVQVVERWLLTYLDAMCDECLHGWRAQRRDVLLFRSWALPDTAR